MSHQNWFVSYRSIWAVQSSITHPLSMVISLSRSKAQHFRSLSTRKHSYPSQTWRRCDWCSIYYYFMKQAENCREAKRRRRADEYLMRICLVSVYGTILQCTLQCIGGNFPKRFALRMNYIPSGRSGGVVGVVGRQNEELLRLSPGNVAFLDFFSWSWQATCQAVWRSENYLICYLSGVSWRVCLIWMVITVENVWLQ